ncbi:hypothetical protein E2C01_098714 [Portunus trituberculatus]|uniref:Uncharacterized protein n=1 Tax=Portunus trituberculatus TaxID=210409 RepID=A0A5B7KEV1_PORTR|nr:hypothetical protein [Portunus trituberculatus]
MKADDSSDVSQPGVYAVIQSLKPVIPSTRHPDPAIQSSRHSITHTVSQPGVSRTTKHSASQPASEPGQPLPTRHCRHLPQHFSLSSPLVLPPRADCLTLPRTPQARHTTYVSQALIKIV